jgi:hypothetical protein
MPIPHFCVNFYEKLCRSTFPLFVGQNSRTDSLNVVGVWLSWTDDKSRVNVVIFAGTGMTTNGGHGLGP